MCTVCGCEMATLEDGKSKTGAQGDHDHHRGHLHDHGHPHDRHYAEHGALQHHQRIAGVHVPGMNPERIVQIEKDILSKNNAYAAENRARFVRDSIFALNFVSSPGSGKTSFLVRAIHDLKDRMSISVIEGDQETSNDAARIRKTGVSAIQINTGKGCHLDAHMVGHAVEDLAPEPGSVLFIENVGNLVCPSAFDLGEAHKVVVLSVTEGEDKPLKYPDMFAAADLMILNKSDLLPHLDFDVGRCIANALRVNPRLRTLTVSARSGDGMEAFYFWLEAEAARIAKASQVV
ncbi:MULTISPECIES: hydrogenase nickel incorporation protein HypB [Rhizobium]|uniref:Hydrogenase maturation factor HypB n=3 Tax=Rhizobium TaxID=379 RepID=A0A6P1CED1_RHITR|nr:MULTISPECIES: hydrogenase nickel incorporation protein HypB [Rhizobium]AGB73464.1 hydrogenase nickel incorporation protein HypB [Rhizobium tropici CIAT 899]AYG76989.1 hydrogenase accessory protein HypB [Rhizobium sp. CCGE532]ENN88340.1 Hydrogenase nickel incorporation protein HypB [Rhizobium freirei PRF 81]MBB4244836.1 hydrogenase nickel incorporation protein HypB [Rhizobium tropici]MBB5596223.1 hydrogenase nickel incorporation protein HypB [Rhizobium tropici]